MSALTRENTNNLDWNILLDETRVALSLATDAALAAHMGVHPVRLAQGRRDPDCLPAHVRLAILLELGKPITPELATHLLPARAREKLANIPLSRPSRKRQKTPATHAGPPPGTLSPAARSLIRLVSSMDGKANSERIFKATRKMLHSLNTSN